MGVRGLKTFMVKIVPNGVFKINIKDEIKKHNGNNSTTPTIVFTVKGLIKCVLQNKKDIICGGRYDQYYEKMEIFLKTLHSLNVNMVFFYGETIITKYNSGKMKRAFDDAYTHGLDVYDFLRNHNMSTHYLTDQNTIMQNIPILDTVQETIYPLLVKYGFIINTIENDLDLELAAFARRKEVLAVIADDTDYLIYMGKWRYWSAIELNPDTFETNEYNKVALLTFLRIKPIQLCLFATCCGNDYCDFYKLKLQGTNYRTIQMRFQVVTNYVKQYGDPFNLTSDELKKITVDIFGEFTGEGLNLVKASISSYSYRSLSTPSSIIANNDLVLQNWKCFPYIYQIMSGRSVILKDKYFDLRDKNSTNSLFNIVLPLYERKMGVLLWHKSKEKLNVTVFAIKSHDERGVANTITPVYPDKLKNVCLDVKHNGIDIEMDGNNIHKNLNLGYKWDLLNWIITECELKNINSIRKRIPDKYLIHVLTLHYLVKQKQLSVLEADVILYTVQEAFENGVPDEIEYPEKIHERAMFISHMFTQVYHCVLRCYDAVRLEKFGHRLNFDGVFFHKSMIGFDNDADLLKTCFEDEKLQTYRIYA